MARPFFRSLIDRFGFESKAAVWQCSLSCEDCAEAISAMVSNSAMTDKPLKGFVSKDHFEVRENTSARTIPTFLIAEISETPQGSIIEGMFGIHPLLKCLMLWLGIPFLILSFINMLISLSVLMAGKEDWTVLSREPLGIFLALSLLYHFRSLAKDESAHIEEIVSEAINSNALSGGEAKL